MDRRRKVKVTQGQFSFLPDLNDAEIKLQIDYGLNNGWALAIEYTDDPHQRNCYWPMGRKRACRTAKRSGDTRPAPRRTRSRLAAGSTPPSRPV